MRHSTFLPFHFPAPTAAFFAILLARTPPGEPTHVGHSIGGLFTA